MKQPVRPLRVIRVRCEFHAIPSPNLLASSDPADKDPDHPDRTDRSGPPLIEEIAVMEHPVIERYRR